MGRYRGEAEDGATVFVELPVELDQPGGQYELAERWPPIGLTGPVLEPSGGGADHRPDETRVIALDPAGATGGPAAEVAWARLESELAVFTADHLKGRVAIHAAMALWSGRTVLLPGTSHAGKSTLSLALFDLGATVLTDEFAVVDPRTAMAFGWNRPVRRRRDDGGIDRVELRPHGPNDAEPLAVDLVAVLHYEPPEEGAEEDRTLGSILWRDLSSAEVAEHLVANTVSAQRSPTATFEAAVGIARHAVGIEGARGDAQAAARALLAHVESLG